MSSDQGYSTGSEFPPIKPGVLRLYSAPMCPFAQRSRLVLTHKSIPFETINIDLSAKPEWYAEKVNPLGKVPAMQKDDIVIFDSAIINDYLDEIYSDIKLIPSDPLQRAKDRMFVESMTQVISQFYKIFFTGGTNFEAGPALLNGLDLAEKELKARNTPFFGGQKMGMLDVALYPHLERCKILCKLSPDFELTNDRFPLLMSWLEHMLTVPAVRDTATTQQGFLQLLERIKQRNSEKAKQ